MRIVFIGASDLSLRTAELLIKDGHEVIIVESNKEKIQELADEMDCSFLQGDGSDPKVLKEVNPEQTDVLFCLTDDDRVNLIAGLVGRSLNFKRVVPSIREPGFDVICRELGLQDTVIPSLTVSRFLADMARGINTMELSSITKGEARFFTFIASRDDEEPIADLDFPEGARVICFYREGKFHLADESSRLKRGDEVVVITHSHNLQALIERWGPRAPNKA